MTAWITDRLPTKTDGDHDGDVAMRAHPGKETWVFVHWSQVKPGIFWKHSHYWEPPAQPAPPAVVPSPPADQPRRFVSLTRTVIPSDPTGCSAVLDAIDQEGRAWWLVVGTDNDEAPATWTELLPLPTREDQP